MDEQLIAKHHGKTLANSSIDGDRLSLIFSDGSVLSLQVVVPEEVQSISKEDVGTLTANMLDDEE